MFPGCPCVHPSLWAQLSSAQTSDSADAAATAKAQFLQKMQTAVSLWGLWEGRGRSRGSGSKPGEFEEHLWEGPELFRDPVLGGRGGSWPQESFPDPGPVRLAQRHGGGGGGGAPAESLLAAETSNGGRAHGRLVGPDAGVWSGRGVFRTSVDPPRSPGSCVDPEDWAQEHRCLLTLQGLQDMVGQCLHRLRELHPGEPTPSPPALKSGCGSKSSSHRAVLRLEQQPRSRSQQALAASPSYILGPRMPS